MIGIEPVYGRILVKPKRDAAVGIIARPEVTHSRPQHGTVIAVCQELADLYKPGTEVIFGLYGGWQKEIEGEEMMFIEESDILGVLA